MSTTMTNTAITLADLAAATEQYLATEVEVRIADVTRNLSPGGDGSFHVKVRNAEVERGVRLRDVTVHVRVLSDRVVLLSADVATVLEARATGSRSDPQLPSDALVDELFVFFLPDEAGTEPSDVLEPGEELEFEMSYHAEGRGTTDIVAHVHASISTDDLFPRTNSPDSARPVTVG